MLIDIARTKPWLILLPIVLLAGCDTKSADDIGSRDPTLVSLGRAAQSPEFKKMRSELKAEASRMEKEMLDRSDAGRLQEHNAALRARFENNPHFKQLIDAYFYCVRKGMIVTMRNSYPNPNQMTIRDLNLVSPMLQSDLDILISSALIEAGLQRR